MLYVEHSWKGPKVFDRLAMVLQNCAKERRTPASKREPSERILRVVRSCVVPKPRSTLTVEIYF